MQRKRESRAVKIIYSHSHRLLSKFLKREKHDKHGIMIGNALIGMPEPFAPTTYELKIVLKGHSVLKHVSFKCNN